MSGLINRRLLVLSCVTGAALSLGACNEKGLPGKNRPLAEAQNKEWRYPAYEKTPAEATVVQFAGKSWQVSGAKEMVPANLLHPVGDSNSGQLLSLKWDEAPYDRLYVAAPGGGYSVVQTIN